MRLALEPRVGDAAVAVEAEHRLGRLHLQRAAGEAAVRAARPRARRSVRADRGSARAPRAAAPARRSGARPSGSPSGRTSARRAAGSRRSRRGGPRSGAASRGRRRARAAASARRRRARTSRTTRRAAPWSSGVPAPTNQETSAMCTHARMPSVFAPERERVVEVLRRVGVDGVGRQVAQVDAVRILGRRRVVRLERLPRAALDEERLEDVLDPRRRPERLLDAARGPSPAAPPRGRRARGRRAPSTRARAARPA